MAAYQAEVEFRHRQFSDDEQTRKNIAKLAKFLVQQDGKFGIMFCGLCGNGKTTLLYALRNAINYLNDCGMFEDRKSIGLRVVDARELEERSKDYERFKEVKQVNMIAIEDMGKEAVEVMDYGNIHSPVEELIEYRYDNQLFTVITTNLTKKQIREKYQTRIADRFNEMMEVIIFENDTYRK